MGQRSVSLVAGDSAGALGAMFVKSR